MGRHTILISVGSNIDKEHYIRESIKALKQNFDDVSYSSVYESESVGFDGSAFYNLVAKAVTSMSIIEVRDTFRQIESDNGRKHGEKKFCSRTLDLDLLTYDDQVTHEPVVLPREEILYNAFVLWPLAELVPNDIHPVEGKTYEALWQAFDKEKQTLSPINFTWS
ncbi:MULTISPECIES: 2-amino-4-hydroxy-6-hydroxymethyldihydropteridine diphosphokinase [Alteromonas]|uniref:2-amino-4-hydroxy-6-hydroxymethyldihydropteridine diphosphokinase n=1 Tax=Alteromonas stellipolaris TaxID=233316 RepID=A0AAW7YXH8_9ALTE|nr:MULTISPECIES: 2-amino-4-hydroxy-6-hydroxymethyldihydropteridine diphosphokinase [Alteromonas]AMJ89641.1 2-amino-4-hydroxy-6-hydroxymethyldihydropteridine pyrophosphokinase [Alteromonas sp. Mac2]ALM91812.1 2-amino-4-hydroxy-6-hydroxymethyldihydropteridine pyrophosphokinase [Alteromonas stellipolaris LMG 21856]AMJ73339.1 2-amino-4-hydroxy-6-hydroxymethyldihydropteridine pyrophosphokinase [Alteromonas stellipolaris]AMJ85781.1 2-amino-4-hydroxy-6-hydroxymethyldihydropteridine pyrophosphokinase [